MRKIKPFVTCVSDYHDFDYVVLAFNQAGFNVSYKEIGCFQSDLTGKSLYGMHHAVFFHPEDKDSKKIRKLITQYKESWINL